MTKNFLEKKMNKLNKTGLTLLTALLILANCSLFNKNDDKDKKKKQGLAILAALSQKSTNYGVFISGTLVDSSSKVLANRTVQIIGRGENSATVLVPNFLSANQTTATNNTTGAASTSTTTIPGGFLYDNSQGAGSTLANGSACVGGFSSSTKLNTNTNCPATYITSLSDAVTGTSAGAQYVASTCGAALVSTINSYTGSDSYTAGTTPTSFGKNSVRIYCDASTLTDGAKGVGVNTDIVASGKVVASFTTDSNGNFNNIKFDIPSLGNTYNVVVSGITRTRRLKINNNGVLTLLASVNEAASRAVIEQSTGKDLTTSESSYTSLFASGVTSPTPTASQGSYDFSISNLTLDINYPKNYQVLSGTLSSSATYSDPNVIYYLSGTVIVPSGVTLTFDNSAGKGVMYVYGSASPGGALLVKSGGKLNVTGTATTPVVFTSEKSAGSRAPADWQGIILQGSAAQTFGGYGTSAVGEGDTGSFGGTNNADGSGTLKYVRIEFAGAPFSPGNERNCLSLMGVGSGSKFSYVQCHRGFDDGFETWGGAYNADHLVSTGNRDDQYDFADGIQAKVQFLIAQIYTSTAALNDDISRCIEGDGNTSTSCTSSARSGGDCSDPYLANVTCVGGVSSGTATNHGDALFLRRANSSYAQGDYTHFLVTNFGSNLPHSCSSTQARISNMIYSNTTGTPNCGGTITNVNTSAISVTTVSDTAPNFIPNGTVTGVTDVIGVTNFTTGFTSATYFGAIKDATDNWVTGWTSFSQN
jgi:hypothetical protein